MSTVASRTIDLTLLRGTKVKETLRIPDELTVLEGLEQPTPGMGTFRILHQEHGDQRITWLRSSLQQINEAKKLFVDLVKKGLTPYKVGTGGKASSEVMREFDPHAEEVIFVPSGLVSAG